MKNRLKLDFTLESARERVDFVNTYIVQFTDLTQGEAATIADYLLWGKDEEGNALGADAGLETRWTKADESESLDAVLENPALANIQLRSLNDATVYKKPRETFDRARTRKEAPDYLLSTFENLWRLIDEVDLEIGFYEERIGKRDKPPREELLKRFSEEEIERIRTASHKWSKDG